MFLSANDHVGCFFGWLFNFSYKLSKETLTDRETEDICLPCAASTSENPFFLNLFVCWWSSIIAPWHDLVPSVEMRNISFISFIQYLILILLGLCELTTWENDGKQQIIIISIFSLFVALFVCTAIIQNTNSHKVF